MNRVRALLMAIALVIAFGYIWKFERHALDNDNQTPKSEKVFAGINREDVQRITAIGGDSSFTVERLGFRPGQANEPPHLASASAPWVLRRPENALADQEKVSALLESALGTVIASAVTGEEREPDQRVYGLVPPEGYVSLQGAFGKRMLSFGKKIAVSGRRYAQPENDPRIYVVEDQIVGTLLIPVESIRERKIFRFRPEDVEQVVVQRPGTDLMVFTRMNELKWQVEEAGMGFTGDGELIAKQLASIARASVAQFIDEPDKDLMFYGLKSPRLFVRIKMKDGSPTPNAALQRETVPEQERVTTETSTEFALQIGEGVPNAIRDAVVDQHPEQASQLKARYFARISGVQTIYEFDKPFYMELTKPIAHFRPRKPFEEIRAEELAKITVSNGTMMLTLTRDGSQWRRSVEPIPAPAGNNGAAGANGGNGPVSVPELVQIPEQVARLEQWVTELRAATMVDYTDVADAGTPEYGLSPAKLTIEIFSTGSERPRKLVLGNSVNRSGDGAPGSDAPRWAAVTFGDGAFLPGILSALSARMIADVESVGLAERK